METTAGVGVRTELFTVVSTILTTEDRCVSTRSVATPASVSESGLDIAAFIRHPNHTADGCVSCTTCLRFMGESKERGLRVCLMFANASPRNRTADLLFIRPLALYKRDALSTELERQGLSSTLTGGRAVRF